MRKRFLLFVATLVISFTEYYVAQAINFHCEKCRLSNFVGRSPLLWAKSNERSSNLSAAEGKITGKVVAESQNNELSYVTVAVGPNSGTYTNNQGSFTIENLEYGNYQITQSATGEMFDFGPGGFGFGVASLAAPGNGYLSLTDARYRFDSNFGATGFELEFDLDKLDLDGDGLLAAE